MRPQVPTILGQLSGTLLVEVAPQVAADYVQKNTAVVSVILMCAAEEWDRAAQRRVDENRELRRILGEAAPLVTDPDLTSRLAESSGRSDPSLTLQALDQENDELRSLLIELQRHVEELDTPEARQIEATIWQELLASTERRELSMSPF
jgi:hypothetical protein